MKKDEWTIDTGSCRDSSERLAAMLNQSFAGLSGSRGEGPWEVSPEDNRVRCSLTIEKGREDFCARTGIALAEFIVSEREPCLLRQWMHKKYGPRGDQVEADVMISEAIALLDGETDFEPDLAGWGRSRRIKRWGQPFADFMLENGFIHLDGFLRFRMKEYQDEVKEAAETTIEERIMERQYQEFMSLLQSMVEWQEVRVPAVHVLHSGGHAFKLLDEKMRPLEKEAEAAGDPALEEEPPTERDDQEEESLLVSRLLAASPRYLYIHTTDPEAQVIRTILGIFGERAALCPDMPT
ncbi:putative sporulation protein YtxC [Cohnella sp. AR92]|uniref:putative sporulation protein YtxC n=1 Tax=Cohnella sp. AR92 TaxID=648716 RepID=UPI0013155B59|nr:putative sporulation protein YtxC [Cohnella sp. AR92]